MKGEKSFFERREGVLGLMLPAAGIVLAGWLILTKSALILSAMQNLLGIVVVGLIVATLLFMVFDKNTRTIGWFWYRLICRKLTGLVVTVDPEGIVLEHVEKMKDRLSKMQEQINKVQGVKRSVQDTITANKKDIDLKLRSAKKAKESNKQGVYKVRLTTAGRMKEGTIELSKLVEKLEMVMQQLLRLEGAVQVIIEDTEAQVYFRIRNRKAAMAAQGAIRSASAILNGNADKFLYDSAMDHMADEISNAMGEMEVWMKRSESFLDGIDIENEMFADEGLEMFEQFMSEGPNSIFELKEKANAGEGATSEASAKGKGNTKQKSSKYDDLF